MGPSGTNWWYVNSVTLPSFEINTGEYQLLNQKFRYPGIPSWNPVTINIVDTATAVQEITKTLGAQGFDFLQEEGLTKLVNSQTRQALLNKVQTELDASIKTSNETIQKKHEADKKNADKPIRNTALVQSEAKTDLRAAAIMRAKNIAPSDANDIVIEQMKSDGGTLRRWTLKNSFVSSVNYGELNYSSDELVTIDLVIAYDYATTGS